ncbi:MAG: carbamate kinase [Methanobacteriota archaeon]|nr:MAG: carbamate kinase [Euryarchaeota archaeon]
MSKQKIIVVAVGGNALYPPNSPSFEIQKDLIAKTCKKLADIIEEGHRLIITHGNGPQVGNLLIQNEKARRLVPSMPLDVLVAETQAQIGYLMQQSLQNAFNRRGMHRRVTPVVTQVVVDQRDKAFKDPTKPVGPYYSKTRATRLKSKYKWEMKLDRRGGYRRLVPSPKPIRIVEMASIRKLVSQRGSVVIAAGGGGVPVIERRGKLVGIEAVIDKDLASSLLANELDARTLLLVTDVRYVSLNFGKKNQADLTEMTVDEAEGYMKEGHFPEGSMGPKMQAAIDFIRKEKREAIITSIGHLKKALDRKDGTRVTLD